MGIFDYIATVHFDKEGFYDLIDVDGRLDHITRQHFWDRYAIDSNYNLIIFYRLLDDASPLPQYVKQSMDQFFYRKALKYLHE